MMRRRAAVPGNLSVQQYQRYLGASGQQMINEEFGAFGQPNGGPRDRLGWLTLQGQFDRKAEIRSLDRDGFNLQIRSS
jgi:hypothetical protein